MLQPELEAFAAVLDSAAQNGIATSQITLQHPLSIEDAYEVEASSVKRVERSGRICGLKVGFTSKAKMIQMGVDQVILDTLPRTCIFRTLAECQWRKQSIQGLNQK